VLAIVNQVPKLGIVLKETLIELSLWSETYVMRVSVSNGCVLGLEFLDVAKALGSFAMAEASHRFTTFL